MKSMGKIQGQQPHKSNDGIAAELTPFALTQRRCKDTAQWSCAAERPLIAADRPLNSSPSRHSHLALHGHAQRCSFSGDPKPALT